MVLGCREPFIRFPPKDIADQFGQSITIVFGLFFLTLKESKFHAMSSAGHILDMINRIKQNKTLRKRKKFKEDNRENMYSDNFDTITEYNFPVVSETELERIKVQIRRTAKGNDRKSLYIFIIAIVVASFIIWAFTKYY